MGFTPQEIADLRRLGISTTAIEKAQKVQNDLGVLEQAGLTTSVVAALIEAQPPSLSDYKDKDTGEFTSDWCGTVLNVPMPDLGVLVKVTITVDNPEAFPELTKAIETRVKQVKNAKDRKKSRKGLAAVSEAVAGRVPA